MSVRCTWGRPGRCLQNGPRFGVLSCRWDLATRAKRTCSAEGPGVQRQRDGTTALCLGPRGTRRRWQQVTLAALTPPTGPGTVTSPRRVYFRIPTWPSLNSGFKPLLQHRLRVWPWRARWPLCAPVPPSVKWGHKSLRLWDHPEKYLVNVGKELSTRLAPKRY